MVSEEAEASAKGMKALTTQAYSLAQLIDLYPQSIKNIYSTFVNIISKKFMHPCTTNIMELIEKYNPKIYAMFSLKISSFPCTMMTIRCLV
jgi:hypothetical protein